jgi:hypothetical protein
MNQSSVASTLQLFGAGGFGAVIGWYLYYVNRYRKAEIKLDDLVTLVGVLGGGAVLALFPARTDLFGAYGLGLFGGFFAYLIVLVILVACSDNFDFDWFLDGRRKRPKGDYEVPTGVEPTARAMEKPHDEGSPVQT